MPVIRLDSGGVTSSQKGYKLGRSAHYNTARLHSTHFPNLWRGGNQFSNWQKWRSAFCVDSISRVYSYAEWESKSRLHPFTYRISSSFTQWSNSIQLKWIQGGVRSDKSAHRHRISNSKFKQTGDKGTRCRRSNLFTFGQRTSWKHWNCVCEGIITKCSVPGLRKTNLPRPSYSLIQ